ncbi:UrcA family protein [Novosphingobium malaysiense]|uniref:UrcA family protein n=1 Tax=Novosphingobium malaysiense TaxID=1348853 RepID=A0A0B1ZLZ2_9SPHN|nr:UrcA family protein [Novosphingobium malaysiense]KHK90203.1 hypothetical protein LK12_16225 [Novosphingobium malaysiense]
MIKPAIVLLATISAFAGLVPTQAESRIQRTAVVKYSDLDLQQPRQLAVLDRRLREAVWQVCGKPVMPGLKRFDDWHRCVGEARKSAEEGREYALGNATNAKTRVLIES